LVLSRVDENEMIRKPVENFDRIRIFSRSECWYPEPKSTDICQGARGTQPALSRVVTRRKKYYTGKNQKVHITFKVDKIDMLC
jgi:hypothetical protein